MRPILRAMAKVHLAMTVVIILFIAMLAFSQHLRAQQPSARDQASEQILRPVVVREAPSGAAKKDLSVTKLGPGSRHAY
jgi:hypothetical protein